MVHIYIYIYICTICTRVYHNVTISLKKFFITNPLILEEQTSFKIIRTQAEQFSGMGNFAMTVWNSTYNPCFSTFDQFFFVFHGLKTGFFCYSLKLNFICYLIIFFTFNYSLWDGGRHTFLWAKTNFNYFCFCQRKHVYS